MILLKCIYCKSNDVVCNGKRKRKVRIKQNYFCNKCKKQFVEVDGFERMRFKPKIIVRAIHMHEDGLSLSKIQNHLWQYDHVKIARKTILGWVGKFSVFLKSDNFRIFSKNKRKNSY